MRTKYKDKSFLKGVGYCLEGISYTFNNEKNFKIEIILGIIAVLLSYLLKISLIEWIIIVVLITFVLVLELLNTAFESIVDLYTQEYNKTAKAVKDVSAATVLIASIFSLVVGALIFIPKIMEVIKWKINY